MRAWWRETLGSSSVIVFPGARPIVMLSTIGTRVPSVSTSSKGASTPGTGWPHLPHTAALRSS
jgi:hypothetical protein